MAMNAPVIMDKFDASNPPKPGARAILGEKFVKTLFADARHKAIYGGRGSAKSWSVATYLPIVASNKTKRIVCARQFMNSIRDSSKELVEKRIRHLGLTRQFTSTDRFLIHNETKSQFLFVGLDRNIESIRSLEGADIVWIEEARTIKARSMEVLLPTIRETGSELIWTWNPELPEDPVDAYFRKGNPPPRSIVTQVDYNDNPFFQASELPHEMEVMKEGNFERYKHVWLGAYDSHFDSKIFANVNIGRVSVAASVRPRYGLDLGFGSDPSVIIRAYVNEPMKQIYIAQEAVGRFTMDELPQMIKSVVKNDTDQIICDSSQPGTIEFLQRRGLNIKAAKKGPGSVKDGINWLLGYEIWIDPDCEEFREEARLYSWITDKLTGKVSNVPLDANNHCWDALRYSTEEYRSDLVDDDDPYGGVLKIKGW